MRFGAFCLANVLTLSFLSACGGSDESAGGSSTTGGGAGGTNGGGSTSSAGAGAFPTGSGAMPTTGGASGTGATSSTGAVGGGGVGGTSGAGGSSGSGGGTGGAGGVGGSLGGAGGVGGVAGSADTGGAPYVPPTGDPIEAPDLQWQYVEFPSTSCRGGAPAGINVNLSSASQKVMIYLEGGGACFNGTTCAINPSTAAPATPSTGIFDRSNVDNPVADWSFIHVPYCTGDVHAGDNPGGDPGTGPQQFVGYRNLETFLQRIVPTFPNVEQVLHTGVSAGGFGAALTADLVARTFPPGTNLTLIDDSGPPMSSQYLPPCLQQAWRELWGFDGTFLADCAGSCSDPNDYAVDWATYLAGKFSSQKAGLISATQDSVISLFYGYGANNCATTLLPTSMSGAQFTAGLMDFRSQMSGYDNFGTYYIDSTSHTWIGGDTLYTTTVGGVRLVDWVRDIIEGTAAAHVGP